MYRNIRYYIAETVKASRSVIQESLIRREYLGIVSWRFMQ